jgi:quercetin dioxygenase-like cupin family protein
MTTKLQAAKDTKPGATRAGVVVERDFSGWPDAVRTDFIQNAFNFQVGQRILSETSHLRVWEIRLAPGERLGAHRHVLDYFWTAVTAGASRQHEDDGTTREVSYKPGETRHFTFGPGEYLLHDLENIGTSELIFVTVEHKGNKQQLQLQKETVEP